MCSQQISVIIQADQISTVGKQWNNANIPLNPLKCFIIIVILLYGLSIVFWVTYNISKIKIPKQICKALRNNGWVNIAYKDACLLIINWWVNVISNPCM